MSGRFLAERDVAARELMDDPGCDPVTLARTYARFPLVNAVVARERHRYRRWIRPRLRRDRPVRLLDIGTGGGDALRRLANWARRDGAAVVALGIDPEERAIEFAGAHSGDAAIELLPVTSRELLATGRDFDVVVSNHLLHHLEDAEVRDVLLDSSALTAPGGIAIHSDLERSAGAYAAFAAITWPLTFGPLRNTFIRPDGLTSIRRSRTSHELDRLAPPGWDVHRTAPWRLDVVRAAP